MKVELLATRGVDYAWCSSLAYLSGSCPRGLTAGELRVTCNKHLRVSRRGLVRMYFIYTPAY